MPRRHAIPQPQERFAERYRHAHERWDREPVGRYQRGAFAGPGGFRGAYANRPRYRRAAGSVRRPAPERSGWPAPVRELSREAESRHLRALADRDLARAVDAELYAALGGAADRIAVYADDAVITLEGVLPHPELAGRALDAAWNMPGVHGVRSELHIGGR